MGKEIDEAFKVQAKGKIPHWAEPMVEYDKAVEWMRRQHWKNNKNKVPLGGSSNNTATVSQVAEAGLAGVGPSAGEAEDQDGSKASNYWANVL